MAYIYNFQTYETMAAVNNAVSEFKSRLDNNPTDWVVVQLLGGSEADGWVVPEENLTDAEINSLDASRHYTVHSPKLGYTFVGLTGTEATAKVLELRTEYAQACQANTITEQTTHTPTNEDMSGYV